MATTIEKILLVGTQAAYNALTPSEDKLYFCSDTGNMYKGSTLYTDGIRQVSTKPTTPAVGKLYACTDTNTIEFYTGSEWVVVRPQISETVSSASAGELVTGKAVYDFVMAQIEAITGGSLIVDGVTASATKEATVEVHKTDGTSSEVVVPGVVTTPSYDPTTRTITLPVSTGEAVTIALGKDIFVDSTKENKYNPETQKIELHLNDGTMIEIPASGLIDIYTGAESTTAKVTVSDTNEISVAVKLAAGNNALVVADGGLMVDLSAYAKTTEVEALIAEVEDDVEALAQRVGTVEGAINVLNGDASTAGSVAKAVADAKTELNGKIATAQTAAEAAQTAADGAVTANSNLEARVKAIEDAWGFGTF